jgi:hypothetical protein
MVEEIEHVHAVAALAEPFDAADALLEPRRIPWKTASLIAAPAEPEEQLLSGTWSTVRFARKLGKPVFLILPDGTVNR